MEQQNLATYIVAVLEKKKAINIELLSVGQKTTLADSFVVASGDSSTMVRALSEEVQYQVEKEFAIHPKRVEGQNDESWILLDYGDVVVHIFNHEDRKFYDLEQLWHDLARNEDIVQ